MKKLASILLLIMLLSAGVTKAQTGGDVYEYATVVSATNATGKPMLYISFSSGDFKEIEIEKNDAKPSPNVNQSPALKQVVLMAKEGWELVSPQMNSNPFMGSWGYFLKRKQK